MFLTPDSIKTALERLFGNADHMIKIWFTLKQMGLTDQQSVLITTGNSQEALTRLFSFGHPKGRFLVPFAHTTRFIDMGDEASRSIIQTTINQWAERTAVGNDPSGYLDITKTPKGLDVKTGRHYPHGLGHGKNGFALDNNARVTIPDLAFAVWYYRQTDLPEDTTVDSLVEGMRDDLNLTHSEMNAVFVSQRDWEPYVQDKQISDAELFKLVSEWINAKPRAEEVVKESLEKYSARIRSSMTDKAGPKWLRKEPQEILEQLLDSDSKSILLLGAPRTGKTRAIDQIIARADDDRYTIQIHDGWGYDELMLSFRPDQNGKWDWQPGELLKAIRDGKKVIVLEEINRTRASQALGEVFSLLEESYRGEEHSITLRNGEPFYIPEDVVIFATMNTIDKSTEDIDDALLGRFAAVEYPPRVEDLRSMLEENGIESEEIDKIAEFFTYVQQFYQLGHGYFAELKDGTDLISYYLTKVRPVLKLHLQSYRDDDLAQIDEKVDEIFGQDA